MPRKAWWSWRGMRFGSCSVFLYYVGLHETWASCFTRILGAANLGHGIGAAHIGASTWVLLVHNSSLLKSEIAFSASQLVRRQNAGFETVNGSLNPCFGYLSSYSMSPTPLSTAYGALYIPIPNALLATTALSLPAIQSLAHRTVVTIRCACILYPIVIETGPTRAHPERSEWHE
ncbi:hypothetical protein VTI28DRAFT_846 [Corynascus sepedonium]